MLQKLFLLIVGLALLYLVVVFAFYFLQKGFIHYPSARIDTTPDKHGFEYENINLNTDDSARLHGWFLPHPNPRFTLLFYHGNAGNISHRIDSFRIFHDLGLSVFIYDYRSYGLSTGKLTENAMYQDAELAWKYLTDTRGIPPKQIIVFGRSLGTAMASWVASKYAPAGLIMESGFTSIPNMARIYYKWMPTQFMVKWYYDSLSRIGSVKCPTLYVHSKRDDLVPYSESIKLYKATQSRKEFLEIFGGHNYGFVESGSTYTEGLDRFIKSLKIQ